jgi:hypothetical protein
MRSFAIAAAVLVLQAAPAFAQEAPALNRSGFFDTAAADQAVDPGALDVSVIFLNVPAGASSAPANVQQIGGEKFVPPEQKDTGQDVERNGAGGGIALQEEGAGGSNSPDAYQLFIGSINANGVWQAPRPGVLNLSAVQQAGPWNQFSVSQR